MARPEQLRGAFPLDDAPRLPLTGDDHPLRREFSRWMTWANLGALALGILLFLSWTLVSRSKKHEPVGREVRITRFTELGVPPSISQSMAPAVSQVSIARAVAPPTIGVPEPVPVVEAAAPTIATQEEISDVISSTGMSDLGAGGDSLVIGGGSGGGGGVIGAGDGDYHPSPDEFVPVEVDPVRIRIEPPVYPAMARQAGVEGTVIVRALVNKKGKVIDVLVIEGDPLLRDAAIVSARTAVFRPALMQNEPVEVWVMMPITFKMR